MFVEIPELEPFKVKEIKTRRGEDFLVALVKIRTISHFKYQQKQNSSEVLSGNKGYGFSSPPKKSNFSGPNERPVCENCVYASTRDSEKSFPLAIFNRLFHLLKFPFI
ncbi:hypothetical protein NPIL_266841 [Nephila pilipes]|uniref:Uncharacterized protein n=1 Tax=Nephila pilipes TaxID=299642 RepID=A0A8X6Q3N9_NEPPI|nr:hypothetical protein NPIL_266841 [Nephila pilipes]